MKTHIITGVERAGTKNDGLQEFEDEVNDFRKERAALDSGIYSIEFAAVRMEPEVVWHYAYVSYQEKEGIDK